MVRPARPEDADAVAPMMILAMGHIAGIFARSAHHEDAIPFFNFFFRQDCNQYSYANTLVYENEEGVLGSVTGYDGKRLHALRAPILAELHKTDPDFWPDDETEPGEYYLDCVNVCARHQGKGIGKILIGAFCNDAGRLGHSRVGLIVDLENPAAKRLYENLDFYTAGQKNFMGHRYFHMVRDLNLAK